MIDSSFTSFHSTFLRVSSSFSYAMFGVQTKQQGNKLCSYLTPSPIGNCSVCPYSVLRVACCPQDRLHVRMIKSWGTSIPFRATQSFLWLMQSKALLYSVKHRLSFFCNPLEHSSFQQVLAVRVPLHFWIQLEHAAFPRRRKPLLHRLEHPFRCVEVRAMVL